MIISLLLLGYLFFVVGNPLTIYSVNRTQEKAMLAYNSADFVGSGRFYRHITDTLNFHTPDLYLAQGHAFFQVYRIKKMLLDRRKRLMVLYLGLRLFLGRVILWRLIKVLYCL